MKKVIQESEGSESEEVELDSSADEEQANEGDAESECDGEETGSKNLAWADSVSKILKTNKNNKPLVLSKAKKLTDVKAKPKEVFEVALEDGNIKKEVVEEKPIIEKPAALKLKRKKDIPGLRVKPDILEKQRERVLAKIATRGVVQLFNSVKNQQKDINVKLEETVSFVRKEKIMKNIDKNKFLDVLMQSETLENNPPKKQKLSESKETNSKVWDVLKDNFMLDAKLKDWDKETEMEEE